MLAAVTLILIAIPAVALAKSRNANPKTNTKPSEEIQKIVSRQHAPLKPFPRGTYEKPRVQTRVQARVTDNQCTAWIKQAGIKDVATAYKLIMKESGCRVNATNKSSGAYGIPQALPAYKMASAGADWRTNPVTQLRWMNQYCISRYGSWANAWNFWLTHHWY